MSSKKRPKGKSRSRSTKPRITLQPPRSSKLESALSPHDKLLKKLNLNPSDILSQRETATELIVVTKNGMKIRAKK